MSSGAQPDLLASSSMLTWISTLSGARCGGRVARKRLDQLDAVERLQPVEMQGDVAALVRLQRTDRVPFEREVGERGLLAERFLHVVLAERGLAERGERAQRLGRFGLADGEQPRRFAPSGGRTGRSDAFSARNCRLIRRNSWETPDRA